MYPKADVAQEVPVSRFAKIREGVRSAFDQVLLLSQERVLLEECIVLFLFVMFPLGYLESLRWPFPGPRATHGILKAMFLLLTVFLLFFYRRLRAQQNILQNLLMVIFVLAYTASASATYALEAAALHLWYPFMSCCILIALSKVRLQKSHIPLLIIVSAVLVFITFSFSFFSLMFRYSVDNIYYFLFLDHRANHLLSELRQYGKYVSLGPYLMLAPLCYIFFFQKAASLHRKALSLFVLIITLLTAVISNNRIDVLVFAIQFVVLLFIFPRKLSVILLALMIPIAMFGLSVTERYFGFSLEERILRPKLERDLETIDIRFTYWETAFYNFRNAPLLGTGPNSYNDVSVFPIRRYYDPNMQDYLWILDKGIGVHNIFIERLSDTGIFGFTLFISLLFLFFRKDAIYLLQDHSSEQKKIYLLFALGSWSWILYGITDNGYGAQGYVTFFFLRGVINHL